MVAWASGVNTKVRRNGTSWQDSCGFIADETRSGKSKRRRANTQNLRQFSVKMIFTYTEYRLFIDWYKNTTKKGFYSFAFPTIDANDGTYSEYRFLVDTYPEYSNTGGDKVEVSMTWEEVTNNITVS